MNKKILIILLSLSFSSFAQITKCVSNDTLGKAVLYITETKDSLELSFYPTHKSLPEAFTMALRDLGQLPSDLKAHFFEITVDKKSCETSTPDLQLWCEEARVIRGGAVLPISSKNELVNYAMPLVTQATFYLDEQLNELGGKDYWLDLRLKSGKQEGRVYRSFQCIR